ncbi:MAG: hypothetical protein WKI04_08575 [Ferruginibacter sp.]
MKAGHLIIREVAFVNKDLLIDSSFQYNDTNDSSTHKYLYNSNKQLIQEKFYGYTIAAGAKLFQKNDFTYDNNGNLNKEIESDEFGKTNSITTYLFNNVVASVFTLSTAYYPVLFNNLPISKTISYPSGNTTQTVNITYTFDNNHRITTETQSTSQSIKVIKKYFYE